MCTPPTPTPKPGAPTPQTEGRTGIKGGAPGEGLNVGDGVGLEKQPAQRLAPGQVAYTANLLSAVGIRRRLLGAGREEGRVGWWVEEGAATGHCNIAWGRSLCA